LLSFAKKDFQTNGDNRGQARGRTATVERDTTLNARLQLEASSSRPPQDSKLFPNGDSGLKLRYLTIAIEHE